ncbi:MAG TPA: hypothetical protein VF181_12430 [Balneolaceae bacterium]
MSAEFITSFIIPVILSLIITPWVVKFALQINAVDNPGGRKIHTSVTPRLGGLAVFSSAIVSVGLIFIIFPELASHLEAADWQVYIIPFCFLGIFLLGFWDDLKPLKPGIKFGVQFIIAAAVYFAGFKISNITNPVGSGMLNVEMIDFPLTLLWIVGITNAFNLIDGLDGLASGVATIASISIFTVSALSGEFLIAALALVMAGALVGFLRYNFSPAKIFLGDSGSLFIGFSMALMSIQSTTKISTGFALLFPMLVLGFPITDTLISMLRRFLGGYMPERSKEKSKSLAGKLHEMFTPDSSHIHHQLLSLGLTHRNTVLLLYFVSAFFALGAFAITQVDNIEMLLIIGLMLGFVLFHGIKKLRYREIAIFNNGMMLPIYERWILNRAMFLGLIDLIFVAASYMLSYKLLYSINPSSVQFLNFEQVMIMVISVQLFTFWITGLYREKIKQMGIGNVLKITSSVVYAVFGTACALLVMDGFPFISALQFLVLDFYLLLTFTLGIRIAYQALSYWFNRYKKTGENVLIYGANENGTMILHKINNSSNSKFKVLGFLDDDCDMEGKLIYGYPVLGGYWKLSKTLRNMEVDCIFICDEDIKAENFNRMKKLAEAKGITIKRLHIRLKSILNGTEAKNKISKHLNEPTISYF